MKDQKVLTVNHINKNMLNGLERSQLWFTIAKIRQYGIENSQWVHNERSQLGKLGTQCKKSGHMVLKGVN